MLTRDGHVKIMDFGLAKVQGSMQLTQVGTTIGTLAYMPPEQAMGEPLDERADIWSFGVVLYELLSGHLPFEGPYEQAIIYSVLNENPAPLSGEMTNVPPMLEAIVNKCLKKNAAERYSSVEEILNDLSKWEQDSVSDKTLSSSTDLRSAKTGIEIASKWAKPFFAFSISILILVIFLFGGIKTIKEQFGFSYVPPVQHLLVIPFTNIGGDSQLQAFCDGLVETLTSKLTQLEQYHGSLWVVPASEARSSNIQTPAEAFKTFGANLTVTGSLQFLNDLFRLTLNLVDAERLRQLNSIVIDIPKSDISALQDQSVIKLAHMLNLELNQQSRQSIQRGTTTVPGAYEFYLQGRGYLQRYENENNMNSAIRLFQHAIELDSKYALAYAGLGEAFWRKYDITKDVSWVDSASKACNKAYSLNQDLAPISITLGMIHAGTGFYAKAVDDFTRALAIEPGNADALRGLAKAYESLNRLDESESTYKRAIQMKADYWGGYNDLGVYYYKHGRYEEAISQFHQVTELTPDNYRGYNNLGGIYYLLKRWSDARSMFERSIELKKTSSAASNLATLYYIEGQYSNSVRMYEIALDFNPHDYLVWGNLASAYYWAEESNEKVTQTYLHAIELAEERQKVNSKDPIVLSHLSGYYSMVGESEKAVTFMEQALNLAPEDVRVVYGAATVYEQLGNREVALYWIEQALKKGYSRLEIEHQPELKKLCQDSRFQLLVKKFQSREQG